MIGGGFAGLAAAAELSLHKTVQVTLVEAADYLGSIVYVYYSCFYDFYLGLLNYAMVLRKSNILLGIILGFLNFDITGNPFLFFLQ